MANNELFPLGSEQSETKDIKRILSQYTKYWYLFLIGSLLGLGAAFLYLRYYAVSQYRVYSTLLIKDDKSGPGLSTTDALSDLSTFKASRNIDNETQVIKSKSLMARVVKELSLNTSYYIEGKVRNIELYGGALPIKVITSKMDSTVIGKTFSVYLDSSNVFELDDHVYPKTAHRFGQQIHKPYGSFTIVATAVKNTSAKKILVHFQDINQVSNYYNQAIAVQPIDKSASILLLSLVDPIPEKAKDVINKLMDVYNREAIEDKTSMATNTLKFLDNRLRYLTTDLTSVEKEVENYKSINGLTDVATQATDYTHQASNYDSQLSEWAIQIDVLESIESYLGETPNRYTAVPSTLGIKDETLVGLIQKFNELQLERERMLRTTQPANPLVINIDEQLTNLRINILENLRNIKRGLQITSNRLKASSGQFQSKVKKVPGMERELLGISRQQLIKQNIYSYLLQKREETALSLAATASIARVIDPAMGGDFPISPNGQLIYLMALLLGVGVPFAGIYALNLLNNKVQSQYDITSVTPVHIIGEISHNSSKETVVVTKGSRTPIAEMFRLVRTNLHFAALGKENLALLVTSSMSGEGKTFFSINLGSSLAITGKRVLVIDLDLRKPKIAKELALTGAPGVTDYLVTNNFSVNDIIMPYDKVENLFIISSGSIPPNPAELMMSSKFTHLIHELKSTFDYVIIDTPPVGQVADAFILSPFIDFTFYLVRYNYTQKAQLEIVKNIHKNKTLNNPLILLNDAKESNGSNYGYGYGYGYNEKSLKKTKVL